MNDTPTPSDRPNADKPKATQRDAVEKLLATEPFRSTGATTLGGRRLEYRVEAAFVPVLCTELGEQRGEPQAAVFTTAYLLEREAGDATPRPVCFAFNGGPGSSSIWLRGIHSFRSRFGSANVGLVSGGRLPYTRLPLQDGGR